MYYLLYWVTLFIEYFLIDLAPQNWAVLRCKNLFMLINSSRNSVNFVGCPTIYLTNKFHVAVRLFSNRSQMTSQCGKSKKKMVHVATAECVTDVLTTFWPSSVIYYGTDARQHGINLFYVITKQTTTDKASFIQNLSAKAAPCPPWRTRQKPFDVIYYLYRIKQSHWLLCVAKDCDWSRKITLLSNLFLASLLVERKLTVKPELNCEIYKS